MSEANDVIKSNISGVERVLVRGKGWIPADKVKKANEVKTKAGWIILEMETMSNNGS